MNITPFILKSVYPSSLIIFFYNTFFPIYSIYFSSLQFIFQKYVFECLIQIHFLWILLALKQTAI